MFRLASLLCVIVILNPASAAEPTYADPPLTAEQQQHWAYRSPQRPALPPVQDARWVRTPIDAFILAKLEANGLKPALEADRLTWLRRVTFDLIGLPPTLREQDDFLADQSANAYEKVVERLLASPHYGERWAQHWLDVVRFSESNGYEADGERPHAWRYRDYVAHSFNSDKPYDQFLREQVAGDLLAKGQPDRDAAELLIATGLHRCGPMHVVGGNVDHEVVRQEVVTEMVNGLGAAVLGMTIGCARCHDHKFDPISQGDYYRLQAFFAATQLKDRDLATAEEKAAHAKQVAAINARTAPLKTKVAALEAPYRARLAEMKKKALEPPYREALAVPAEKRTPEQKKLAEHANILLKITWDEVVAALSDEDRIKRQQWRDEIHAIEAHMPPPPAQAWAVADDEKIPPTYVLKRGDVKQRTITVEPAVPRIVAKESNRKGRMTRIDLAHWLTRADHPLTTRVWVNRLWQHHFGRGLVATPNDFGSRGERPSHPELLDWLATELPRRGWSTKEMHRLMVLSATYRMRSKAHSHTSVSFAEDNRLLARMNRRRLEGEALRDAMLAAAGTLNRAVGGPKVLVPLEPEVYDLIFTEGEPDGLWKATPDPRQHTRRSLYLFAKRNVRQPLLEAFDQPDTLNPCPVRPVSIFAPQALILMNGPLAQAQSKAMAADLLRKQREESALVELAYRRALGRSPRREEMTLTKAFLHQQTELLQERLLARLPVGVPADTPPGVDPAFAAALADFCLTLFNLNEFIYVD